MTNEISFKDLAKELGLSFPELAAMRDERLTEEHYFVRDGKRFFTEAGAEVLRLAKEVPLAVPKKLRGVVVRPARNARYVYVKFAGQDAVVPVAIPRRLFGKLLHKQITVDVITDAQGGTSYRHADLGS